MRNILFNILLEIGERKGGIGKTEYDEAISLRGDLGFDSFDLAELTVKLEDQTNIDIFEENLLVDTVGDILLILNKRRVG